MPCARSCSVVFWLLATPWTVAHQAPLSMGFPRQECWSELLSASPGDLPDSGIEPASPKSPPLQKVSWPLCHLGSPAHRCGVETAGRDTAKLHLGIWEATVFFVSLSSLQTEGFWEEELFKITGFIWTKGFIRGDVCLVSVVMTNRYCTECGIKRKDIHKI